MATHTFTREELYRLVWSEPMIKLADRYKISGNGLAKACKKANIPTPARGHWAKIRASHKVEKPALPKSAPGSPWQVTINPPRALPPRPIPPHPESVIDAIEQAKATIQPVEVKMHCVMPTALLTNGRKKTSELETKIAWAISAGGPKRSTAEC